MSVSFGKICSLPSSLVLMLQWIIGKHKPSSQRRQWPPTPVLLHGNSHGERSLVGCGPWGREELDMTEQLPFHFSLSWIREGNGNPLQCSCLENPRDGGAWLAAVYGVTRSQTWLKWLSSSNVKESRFNLALLKIRKVFSIHYIIIILWFYLIVRKTFLESRRRLTYPGCIRKIVVIP